MQQNEIYLVSHCQGPYGNFGKVDDFKVIEAKTVDKGKRKYRQVCVMDHQLGFLLVK